MCDSSVYEYRQSMISVHQPSPSRSIKRKCHYDDDTVTDAPNPSTDGLCPQTAVQRTQSHLPGSDELAEFYPLPPNINQAVLASVGVGGSKQRDLPMRAWGMWSYRTTPGLLQPPTSSSAVDSFSMDEDMTSISPRHGPHCQSIPQLSVRSFGPTSQLWAYCPDCHAFAKVPDN